MAKMEAVCGIDSVIGTSSDSGTGSVKGSGSVAAPGGNASSSTKQVSKEPKAAIGAEPQVQENQEPPQKKVRKFGKAKAKEP